MSQAPPYSSEFPALAAPNVIPEAFKDVWEDKMEAWGSQMKAAVEGVAKMLSIGLGLDEDTLLEAGRYG
jgi:isopenicillin N synthase-like dioxygenase